jgi:hypothetical protein
VERRLVVAGSTSVCIRVLRTRTLRRTLARVLVVVWRVWVVVTSVRVEVRHTGVHRRCGTKVLRVSLVLHLGHVRLGRRLGRAVATAVVGRALRTL